jgi:hypothetical protein
VAGSAPYFRTISHDASATLKFRLGGKNIATPLSRWREREGVRVDMIITFPLTAAFPASGSGQRATFGRNLPKGAPPAYLYIEERERHPVFSCLYTAERDFILSPRGEERNLFARQPQEMICLLNYGGLLFNMVLFIISLILVFCS